MAIPDAGTSTINVAFVEQYKNNLIHLSQQKSSKLREYVRVETMGADGGYFDRIGATDAVEKTTRHTVTPILDVPHSRRKITMKDYHWADLVDQEDKIRMLISPESEYAKNGAMAMGRQFDNLILDAAIGNALDGDGTTTIALPAGQKIAHGSASLTIAKLLEAKEILWANDVDDDDDPLVIACSGTELVALLNTTEVKSADYNTVKALAQGDIDTFMGFKFVRTNLVNTTAGSPNLRHVTAWRKSGMALALGQDVKVRMSERDDVSYAVQVYLSFTADATRVEDEKVVQIDCSYT